MPAPRSSRGGPKRRLDVNVTYPRVLPWQKQPVHGWSPPALQGHVAHVIGGRLYVFGGQSVSGLTADGAALDLETLRWTQLEPSGPRPSARAFAASWADSRRLWVHGGEGLADDEGGSEAFGAPSSPAARAAAAAFRGGRALLADDAAAGGERAAQPTDGSGGESSGDESDGGGGQRGKRGGGGDASSPPASPPGGGAASGSTDGAVSAALAASTSVAALASESARWGDRQVALGASRRFLADLYALDVRPSAGGGGKLRWKLVKSYLAPLARKGHTATVATHCGRECVVVLGGATVAGVRRRALADMASVSLVERAALIEKRACVCRSSFVVRFCFGFRFRVSGSRFCHVSASSFRPVIAPGAMEEGGVGSPRVGVNHEHITAFLLISRAVAFASRGVSSDPHVLFVTSFGRRAAGLFFAGPARATGRTTRSRAAAASRRSGARSRRAASRRRGATTTRRRAWARGGSRSSAARAAARSSMTSGCSRFGRTNV